MMSWTFGVDKKPEREEGEEETKKPVIDFPLYLRAKTVIVGASTVGKTAIKSVFMSDGGDFPRNYSMTQGVDISTKLLQLPNENASLDFIIVDCSGKKEYEEEVVHMWDQPVCILVVYDVTNRTSFEEAVSWANKMRTHYGDDAANMPAILVGNKADLEDRRVVTTEEGENAALLMECPFVEISAMDWEGVVKPFRVLGMRLCEMYRSRDE